MESDLILLGTDYDNEGKPIAYLGKEVDRIEQLASRIDFQTRKQDGKRRSELYSRLMVAGAIIESRNHLG